MGGTRPPQPVTSPAAALARAYGYPYPRPEASFVFAAGRAWPLVGAPPLAELRRPLPAVRLGAPVGVAAGGTATPERDGRAGSTSTPDGGLLGDLFPLLPPTPPPGDDASPAQAGGVALGYQLPPPGGVTHEPWHTRVGMLGIGSNGAPVQLGRKFGATTLLPVLRAHLAGAAVVYAPEVAAYASIPATIVAAPAGAPPATVSLTLLSPAQLTAMHATELTYGLCVVPPGSVWLPDVGGGVTLDTPCLAYVHRGGALTRGVGVGRDYLLVAEMLREGEAAGRKDVLTQRQVQRLVAGLVAAAAKCGGMTAGAPPITAVPGHGQSAGREVAAAAAEAAAVAAVAAALPHAAAGEAALDAWVLANLDGAAGRAATLRAVRSAAVPRVPIPGYEEVEDAAVAAAIAVWAPQR